MQSFTTVRSGDKKTRRETMCILANV